MDDDVGVWFGCDLMVGDLDPPRHSQVCHPDQIPCELRQEELASAGEQLDRPTVETHGEVTRLLVAAHHAITRHLYPCDGHSLEVRHEMTSRTLDLG